MSDLISRSALLRYIEDQIDESKEELDDAKARGNERDVAFNHGEIAEARRIKRYINMCAPAVDSVPVVRCRDCKEYEQDCGYCDYWDVSRNFDDYCSCGAKMDGGAK